jgi:alpha-D-ribose 1-methylphosphonate 5-triphosphate diphosphatase
MTQLEMDLTGAQVLLPGQGLHRGRLSLHGGQIVADPVGRAVDLSGFLVLPGIVDLHGDAFERHVAPRRGAMKQMAEGLLAAESEIAANGVSTAVLAQFWSWEGGLRGPDFADQVLSAMSEVRAQVVTDLVPQLRFEISLLEDYADLPGKLADWDVPYVVFNDHLPHDRLAQGRRPKQLTGQALKAGRNPDRHFEMLLDLHARMEQVPPKLEALCETLANQGVRLGSHDDHTQQDRAEWRARGVRISEFPETVEAAQAARDGGDAIVLGSPNVVRGGSHKGNASAIDLVMMGLCDALASDYHYPSLRRAALLLERTGVTDLAGAWALVSENPARILGLTDRGQLCPGQRADLVVLDEATRQVAATLSGGRVSFARAEFAARLLAA